jgi:hypothetical protein
VGDKYNPTFPAHTVSDSYIDAFKEIYGPLYQSFDYGGIHFVLLNSPIFNSGLRHETEQIEWLEADLEKHRGKRIHVFSHYPPYIYTPQEPSNYDNLDEPARSWLLGLLEEHDVEALFAGHVHHYGYKLYGSTRIHNLLSTCFVRQDYAEMFRVEAADEYGRNDAVKLGYCTVDVYEKEHIAKIHRSYGKTLKPDEVPKRIEKPPTVWGPLTPLGVHLRHPLAETVVLPYNGPIDEFVRKKTWNDYTLLGLLETGVKGLRLPISDLVDSVIRSRLYEMHELGYCYGFFMVNIPTDTEKKILAEHQELVDFLEIILPWETASDLVPQASALREELSLPIYVANIESSVHREKRGPKYSHYVSHGFRIQDTTSLDTVIQEKGAVEGFVFQVGQYDDTWSSIKQIDDYAERMGIMAIANIKLSPENPAESLCDENHVANRTAESLISALRSPRVKVFLDTFMDLDRGYFPRIGMYDRRLNPRKGSLLARHLMGAVTKYGVDIELGTVTEKGGWRILKFHSPEYNYELLLPQINVEREGLGTVLEISDGEIIDLETGRTTTLLRKKLEDEVRDSQYLVVNSKRKSRS